MKQRFTTGMAILLLASLALACSFLYPKRPLTWHITLEIDGPVPDREAATKQAVRVLESRLNALGVSYAKIEAQGTPGNGRILVSLPEVTDRERLKKLLTAEGRLELVHVVSPPSPAPFQSYGTQQEAVAALGETVPANRRVVPYPERNERATNGNPADEGQARKYWLVVESPAVVDGTDLRNAVATEAKNGSAVYTISFSLRPSGAEKFGDWTASHINEYLGVVYNGEVKSVAYIKSQITDQGEISGRFTKQAAEDLALVLRSGTLPAPVRIVEEGADK